MRLAAGVLMVLIAFGRGGRAQILRCCLAFFCLSACAGGAVFALYYLLGNGSDFTLLEGIAYLDLPLGSFFALLPGGLSGLPVRVSPFYGRKGRDPEACGGDAHGRRQDAHGHGPARHGCLLCDPLSGRPAVVAERELLFDLPVEADRPASRHPVAALCHRRRKGAASGPCRGRD